MKKQTNRGIILIAVGHSNYAAMAQVLAASIKVNEPTLQIALATDKAVPEWLSVDGLIDQVVEIPEAYITHEKKPALIKAKLHMYDLSPFQETIFLDVDQIMIAGRKLSPVFEELADVDLTFSNTGLAGGSIWADIAEVKKLYGDKAFWNFHSEFVFFRKSKAAAAYFKAAQKVFSDNKIRSATVFGGAPMADELAFQCAAMITGLYPHKQNWLPNFWFDRNQNMNRKFPYELTDYLTYSIGGKIVPAFVKNNYNNLAKHYFATLGLLNPYQVVDKQTFLPERNNI